MSDPRKLADGVVRLGTSYVNWYLVADDSGVTVVDAGVAGYSDQLEPGLKLLGRSLGDVRAFVLTHGDADPPAPGRPLPGAEEAQEDRRSDAPDPRQAGGLEAVRTLRSLRGTEPTE